MINKVPPLTVGIEEELFIVDKTTRALASLPDELVQQLSNEFPQQIIREFLDSQAELVSKSCNSLIELREELYRLRKGLIQLSDSFNLAPIAASIHPFACWSKQGITPSERYDRLFNHLQVVARRMLVSGMHIHVGLPSTQIRLDLLNRLRWYLPYFLALSASSPFWQGQDTGLASFRLSIIDSLPRAGLPQRFHTLDAYNDYVDAMVKANIIKDASELWWDIRMSCRFPTLELRVADVCTHFEDIFSIAALYLSLTRYLYRHMDEPAFCDDLTQAITAENRWRASRFSIADLNLISPEKDKQMPVLSIFTHLVEKLYDDAKALSCETELENILAIIRRGTSSDSQRKIYQREKARGASEEEALSAVVDYLMAETKNF